MKKILLSFIFLFCFQINAQDISFGFRGAANLADLLYKSNQPQEIGGGTYNFSGFKAKLDFSAGFFADIKLNQKFSIQPELQYSRQGAFASYRLGDGTFVKSYLNNDYINLPILIKHYFEEKFNFFVGPQIGYLISANTVERAAGKKFSSGNNLDLFNKIDYAAVVGIGFDAYEHFKIDIRYNFGLNNIIANPDPGEVMRNYVFQLGVGYVF